MAGGQFVNHFGAVRLRVTGSGNLGLSLFSLDDINTQVLIPVAMASTDRYPNVLANFMTQKAKLVIETNEIDEVFLIREVIIYSKPVFTGFPQ